MQLPPIEVILSWPTPNYTNPKVTRGSELVVLSFVFYSLAILLVALRTFTRVRISRSFGVDDIFLLAAVPPTTAVAILTSLAQTKWGWNRHIWDVPFDLVTLGLKVSIAMELLFAISVSCTKISLLILTRRIMTNGTGILRHVAAAVMAVVALEAVIFSIVAINTCSPVPAYWTLSTKPQHCINERLHLFIGGIINTSTDFLVFFLPFPTIFSLQIPRRQQIILTVLMGAGFSVCVAGVFRIYYSWKSTSTYDRTWVSYGLWISSVLELNIGIICTSIPACKPFFTRYLPSIIGSSSFGGTKGTSSHTPKDSSYHPPTITGLSSSRKQVSPSLFSQDETDADPEAQADNKESKQFELKLIPTSKFSTTFGAAGGNGQGLSLPYLNGKGSGGSGSRGQISAADGRHAMGSDDESVTRKESSDSSSTSSQSTKGSRIHGESRVEVFSPAGSPSGGEFNEGHPATSTEVLVKTEWSVIREE